MSPHPRILLDREDGIEVGRDGTRETKSFGEGVDGHENRLGIRCDSGDARLRHGIRSGMMGG